MGHVSYTMLRQKLAHYMDETINSNAPLLVTRQGKPDLVLIPASEYAGMEETLHLLRSPANARRLLRSIRSAGEGSVTEHALQAAGDAALA